ncbi:hypothetical protein HCZ30_08525 [Marivivens donghaensis]|uniref:Uncharacterized protein n=1 Tax=Marivivens donghaensis TaxID=1699413 RepID=A0ABX0VWM0_9RHOB|nr:hypothetical protein [Marivivens donghaensis]NIY72479.1 hypothetical protein [Marivivens donghaensis]
MALSLPLSGQAQTVGLSGDPLRIFATCTGRLSALMEFQWMFDGPLSEQTEAERARMIGLIDAIMPPEKGRDVLAWRINAKYAQSRLLTRARFASDSRDATWAAEQAERMISECRALMLS